MEKPVRPGDTLLGKYRVERVLGQGGMGIVVAARHIHLDELYAIKLLRPDALEMPQAVERFLREARASARLKGEHIAKVHDVGTLESGIPYMVMEFLEGRDLRTILRVRGVIPAEEAVELMLQVCDAIEEAHGLGIVHRDLKPANLFLVRRPNGTACIKVLDFGISKHLLDKNAAELTKSGEIIGTPMYMPPEQMLRMKDADPRSDLWTMGVILCELVTGQAPFRAESMPETIARVLQEEAPPPSRLHPGLPAWLDAIVARCLQKQPEKRFQTVAELAEALREHAPADTVQIEGFARAPRRRSSAALVPPSDPPPPDHNAAPIENTLAVQTPNGSSTVSGWGGSGGRATRGSGKIAVALAALLGLGVSGAGAVWLFRGHAAPLALDTLQPVLAAAVLPPIEVAVQPVPTPSSEPVPAVASAAPPSVAASASAPVPGYQAPGLTNPAASVEFPKVMAAPSTKGSQPSKPGGKYDLPETRK